MMSAKGAAAAAAPSGRREQTAAQKKANDALWYAAEGLVLEDMKAALDAGADPLLPGEDWTAAMHVVAAPAAHRLEPDTCATLQVAALRLLATYGGLDAATATGVLTTAVQRDCGAAVVQTLLDAGADPRHADEYGMTALHHARCADVVRLLVAAGASVDAENARGCRPLLYAAAESSADERRLAVMSAIIAAGAKLDAISATGDTALSCAAGVAAMYATDAAVKLLLKAGADPTIVNYHGRTALVCAVRAMTSLMDGQSFVFAAFSAFLLEPSRDAVRMLARAEAWRRRRHALLAMRGHHGGAPAGAAVSAAAGSADTHGPDSKPAASL